MVKVIKYILLSLLVLILAFFAVSYFKEFKPEAECPVVEYYGRDADADAVLPDTIRIMTWNIGYAGLGDNMDFCVDGGVGVRDSKLRTGENLFDIIARLKAESADIYLLQEVDEDSHRTYGINEIRAIATAFPDYYVYFAPNFDVWFVPSPLKEPIGSVRSGVVIISRFKPTAVRRLSYPSSFSFPVRMFNLKRCLLEADFIAPSGQLIHIGNTHNTAFDTGGMRVVENEFLKARMTEYAKKGESFIFAGDWNQCPPQYVPSKEELENEYFAPEIFDTSGVNSFASVLCDSGHYSMRYNDKPYSSSSTKSLLDFFIVSRKDIDSLCLRTLDLDFHSSDHNPVVFDLRPI